jgi:hypothetical protein
MEEFLMADTDFSKQFDKVSDSAKAAADKVREASAHTRDQLEADADAAREKATKTADQLKEKAAGAHEKASSQWQEVRANWRDHVTKMKQDLERRKAKHDAKEAAQEADWVEGYALDAIDFAGAVIEEAASAALDAMYLRAYARASAEEVGS